MAQVPAAGLPAAAAVAAQLDVHMLVMLTAADTTLGAKPVDCPVCSVAFATHQQMLIHAKTHGAVAAAAERRTCRGSTGSGTSASGSILFSKMKHERHAYIASQWCA